MKTLAQILKQETIKKSELDSIGITFEELNDSQKMTILKKLVKEDKQAKKSNKLSEFIYTESVELSKKLDSKSKEFKDKNKTIRRKSRAKIESSIFQINSIKDKQQIENFIAVYKEICFVNDYSLNSVCGSSTGLIKKLQIEEKMKIVKQFVTKK